MCGIVGYIGRCEAVDFLVAGLRRLEYRGYDSSGLAELYQVSIAGGVFGELRSLGHGVNTRDHTENEPTMAPDGSYMIFYSAGRPDNLSSEMLGDLI